MKGKLKGKLIISIILLAVLVLPLFATACEPVEPVPTLKIGCLEWFGFPLGIDCVNELDAIVPVFNAAGGLVINGQQYNIEMIIEDSGMDPPTALAAVEKLIYQDEVDFIISDETTDWWLDTTEENEVLVVACSPSPVLLDPAYEYVFQASSLHTNPPSVFGWFVENHCSGNETFAAMFSDDLKGHAEAAMLENLCATFNVTLLDIQFYNPAETEFSSYAEALVALDPDVYTTCAGGPVQDSLSMKAMRDAGFEGQILLYVALSLEQIEMVLGDLSAVEGMIAVAVATELDPPTAVAQELMDAYIAEHGEWTYPVILHINAWYCLMEALDQAQSLVPADVAAVIADGMAFETPQAPAVMISRPDFGNNRTVDALFEAYMIQVVGGEAVLIDTISLAEALEKVQMTFP